MTAKVSPEEVLKLARSKIVQSRELEACGVSRTRLRQLVASGILERLNRGLYMARDFDFDENISLAEVAIRCPKAVMCLLTALRFHDLTTENPQAVHIMLPLGSQRPHFSSPSLNVSWSSPAMLAEGVEERLMSGVTVRITSAAKTVVDCFKYRRTVGLPVAIEALHDAWNRRKASADDLWRYAKLCRMTNVMRPYFDSLMVRS
jgi:predicted transcriptional regulator of viral defense system